MNKKILIIYPSGLAPAVMMSQKRAVDQILALSVDNNVEVLCISSSVEELGKSRNFFRSNNLKFHSVLSVSGNFIIKKIITLKNVIFNNLFAVRFDYQRNSSNRVIRKIIKIIQSNSFDIVIVDFWFAAGFFRKLKGNQLKALDTHGLVEEFIELTQKGFYHTKRKKTEKRIYLNNLKYQRKIHKFTDLLVLNSAKSYNMACDNYPDIKKHYCANGIDLSFYKPNSGNPNYNPNKFLYYGSLGSNQNNDSFSTLFEKIWPLILNVNKDADLIVLGNNPPNWIRNLAQKYSNITVTGYIEDIRETVMDCCCMVLPMNLGVGFRGRAVEVMSLGVPVIGNHNALDCIGITNRVNGFISDDYGEIAGYALKLSNDSEYRLRVSKNTLDFIRNNFSIESTYGKLSEILNKI